MDMTDYVIPGGLVAHEQRHISKKSASYLLVFDHPHLHMLQHSHHQAFSAVLLPHLTVPAAPMGPQDSKFNTHPSRGALRSSFAPISAFHRAEHKSVSSTKQGQRGAQHVCIAWRIYHHQRLKKMQQKAVSLQTERTPEIPLSHPDGVHKESEESIYEHRNLDSECGHSGKTAETLSSSKRSVPSDLYTSAPAFCHSRMTKEEDQEKLPHLLCKEKLVAKETRRSQQINLTKDLPLTERFEDQTVTPGPDRRLGSSLGRKRQLEWDSFVKGKRLKQETVEDKLDPSHSFPVQGVRPVSVPYPNSCRCNITRPPGGLFPYPGAEMCPYNTMWDSHKRMDLYCRPNALRDFSCKACGIPPPVPERQKEAFPSYFNTPLYFPLAVRQQVYLREKELLHQQSCHLHNCGLQLQQPGFLQTSSVWR